MVNCGHLLIRCYSIKSRNLRHGRSKPRKNLFFSGFFHYLCLCFPFKPVQPVTKNNWLLPVAAAGVLYFLWRKAQAVGNLNFIPRGVNVNGGTLQLILGIQNPSSSALTLNSFVGNLLVNGGAAGNVTFFNPVTIQPNAETEIPVTISPNVFGVISSIVNTLEDGSAVTNTKIALSGQANVGTMLYPINLQFT